MYYAISGSFANGIIIHRFTSRVDRDRYVDNAPDNSMMRSHFDHDPHAVTRRAAQRQLAHNNRIMRDHQKYGAPYCQCYGTTGKLGDIEPTYHER